jgi:DNA-binding transcriptional ArsR family regulator
MALTPCVRRIAVFTCRCRIHANRRHRVASSLLCDNPKEKRRQGKGARSRRPHVLRQQFPNRLAARQDVDRAAGHVVTPFDSHIRQKNPPILLDNKSCQGYHLLMLDIQVIDDPAAATVALEPMRSRLLAELVEPASAATLATRVGLARQKVNYHLHALEAHGLVRLAEERKWGGLTERLLVATAASYVVSPGAMGPVAVDPSRERDRLSASYLIALGARVVREVADLDRRATETGKRLATLAVDTEVRFRSAADRAAFSSELTEAITKLVSKYHDESAPGGRAHRLVVVAHPLPQKSEPKELS